jgi:hypothetical protein
MAARNLTASARVTPTRHEFERMTLAAECRRHAAYRRLALTILGLDISSLVQALPLTRERAN